MNERVTIFPGWDAAIVKDIEEWRRDHPESVSFWAEDDGTFVLMLQDKQTGEVLVYRVFHDQP